MLTTMQDSGYIFCCKRRADFTVLEEGTERSINYAHHG